MRASINGTMTTKMTGKTNVPDGIHPGDVRERLREGTACGDQPLEASALEWLRYDRRCLLVCTERTPMADPCRPDVLGVLPNRRLIEIEIKRSMADFRANGDKRGMQHRPFWPSQFYFLVPREMVEKVRGEMAAAILHESYSRAGLLTLIDGSRGFTGLPQVVVITRAQINKTAVRLSVHQIARMVRH